ncbi:MAG: tRNA dihydrouridine synthase DusB [Pseudomonadota bacterium]
MNIGSYNIPNNVFLAPMAGISDLPFRKICRKLGAGYSVTEMVSANNQLWNSKKSQLRRLHSVEDSPRAVQIVGSDPKQLALAAQFNVQQGAEIIDINMGCPAKKVCKVLAGSALLGDEELVKKILDSVVNAVDVPVTLKIRTGTDKHNRNGVRIAKIAENCGIQMLTVHGRTRECRFKGQAEYGTIFKIKKSISIPVVANGDINSPEKAKKVLAITNADAIMIGRAAQGRPWLFSEVNHYLKNNKKIADPSSTEMQTIILTHLNELYSLYGKENGVRIARKHIGWYLNSYPDSQQFKKEVCTVDNADSQFNMVRNYLHSAELIMEKVA